MLSCLFLPNGYFGGNIGNWGEKGTREFTFIILHPTVKAVVVQVAKMLAVLLDCQILTVFWRMPTFGLFACQKLAFSQKEAVFWQPKRPKFGSLQKTTQIWQ